MMRASQLLRLRAAPRMAFHSTPRARMPQDMPPVGGYEQVQYKRNLPVKGFRPIWYVFGTLAIMSYGWYKYAIGAQEMKEKIWARLHLLPLLTAEDDRDQVRRYYADKARAKDLLGSDVDVYHSDRFVRPTYSITPPPAPLRLPEKKQ